jgi:drug/metabolite transporter (DMT)-like permease
MSAYQLLLNEGEVRVPAGPASMLVAVAPVFSVTLAAAFLRERLTRTVLAGSGIALAGAAVIALGGGSARFSASALIVLAAAAVQGTYHVASKPLLRRYSAVEVACYAMWSGTIFLLPLGPAAWHALGHASGSAVGAALYLGLLPSALGFVSWGYAVARLPLATAAGRASRSRAVKRRRSRPGPPPFPGPVRSGGPAQPAGPWCPGL